MYKPSINKLSLYVLTFRDENMLDYGGSVRLS